MTKSPSKSTLFLIEMIIAILFFSVASAICVGLFAKGDNLSNSSSDLNQALLTSQSLAESLKVLEADEFLALNQATPINAKTSMLYYDQDWKKVAGSEKSTYQIELLTSQPEHLATTTITARKNQVVICELIVKKYWP